MPLLRRYLLPLLQARAGQRRATGNEETLPNHGRPWH